MNIELKQFQEKALKELRQLCQMASFSYGQFGKSQIISFTAPTGAGKTIILSALLESIYYGDEYYPERPNAITIWLSDDPELNQQSKDKIEARADRFHFGQCVIISDPEFDQEVLDDGMIYFINTQKLSISSNLTKHSETRKNTIWETLENTITKKGDRLYFVIDEAHRGAKGSEAGKATTIMQKFIFGDPEVELSKMPIVLGMSATVKRFNQLVGNTDSTVHRYEVPINEVRKSGLLKDKITIAYPEEEISNKDMAVLQAATDEWIDKWNRWTQYCKEQHYRYVNPILLVQVENGHGNSISDTDIADCISKIEGRHGKHFKEGEVVHSFGSPKTAITVGSLRIPYLEPSKIAETDGVKIVFFKDALSTGWDCPRAETMMSFRKANDSTYIAQLLGRMIRTPLQMRVQVDETLNEVKLFLPHFNQHSVEDVVKKLKDIEGGDLPTEIESSGLSGSPTQTLSVRSNINLGANKATYTGISCKPQTNGSKGTNEEGDRAGENFGPSQSDQCQEGLFALGPSVPEVPSSNGSAIHPQSKQATEGDESFGISEYSNISNQDNTENSPSEEIKPSTFSSGDTPISTNTTIDRIAILNFINAQGYPTFSVRKTSVNNYLKSLFDLARLLSQSGINITAAKEVKQKVVHLIAQYIQTLKAQGKYENLVKRVMQFRLAQNSFDATGEHIDNNISQSLFSTTDSDIDRQYRVSEAKLGSEGIGPQYIKDYSDLEDELSAYIDVIIFASDPQQIEKLQNWAEVEFHNLKDAHRMNIVKAEQKVKEKFEKILKDGDAVSELIWNIPYDIVIPTDKDGELFADHLYVDGNGNAQFKLNNWERAVLTEERKNPDFVCWLRNVDRKPWALCIPYVLDNEDKPKYPDFIIVRKTIDGYVLDVLEPHGLQYTDNLALAKGLAKYSEKAPFFGRIQLIRVTDGPGDMKSLHRLDLTNSLLREKVLHVNNNEELNNVFNNL
ncbi:MAG: DEAD/DEAH box helicase family protein [Bacteroidales bacterium]|nr:DEAD/DEAH box helicase family protein [Bacteroidales bacterium]